jgi:Zn-dependent M28 family amino/carboxypeptidase
MRGVKFMRGLSGESILGTVEKICGFGNRWMGSEGVEKTRAYIVRALEEAGFVTGLQAFSYLHYEPVFASLQVAGRRVNCQPIALTPSTVKPLEGLLVYGGQCTQENLNELTSTGTDLRNAIILSDNLRSFVAYPEVEAAGAAGFISLTTLPDNTIHCGCARLDGKAGTIPGVAVGGNDGAAIFGRLTSGETLYASIRTQGHTEKRIGHNVIASRSNSSARKRLITAHYDGFWNGVVAMDNAAGVATALALSRTLPPAVKNATEFVFFSGEELGCWGSVAYVREFGGSYGLPRTVLNLDTFGSSRSKLEIGVTPDLAELCRSVVEEKHIVVDCWNIPPRKAGDQQSFVEQGVSAIWLANGGTDPRYHTPLDVPAAMSSENLQRVAELAWGLTVRLIEST